MAFVGIFVFFSMLGIIFIFGMIEKLLNDIIYKIEMYFYKQKEKKDIEAYYKNLYENKGNFVMILNRKAQNGNLKNGMSKINVIDPQGNKLVVIFGSFWNDMNNFYIDVFGNDIGFKYIIRKSDKNTRNILDEYLKARKNMSSLAEYYWRDFEYENRFINVKSDNAKILYQHYSRTIPTNYIIEEQYECERCLKKISREEYELYDCMCEDCFEDISYKDDGSF